MPVKFTDYLRDLATRLRKVPVCYGVDGYDIDSLREVSMGIAELEKANVAYVDANTALIRKNADLLSGEYLARVVEERDRMRKALERCAPAEQSKSWLPTKQYSEARSALEPSKGERS